MLEHLLYPVWCITSALFNRVTVGLVAVLLTLAYFYISRYKNYWRSRGVASYPYRFPLGSVGLEFFWKPWLEICVHLYNKTKEMNGIMFMCGVSGPVVSITDPDLIKTIMVKDFDHFVDRSPQSTQVNHGIFSKMLVSLSGQKWKDMRVIISPLFSTGKIRIVSRLCETNAERLVEQMAKEVVDGEIEMKDILSRYTMENISSVAFGQEANSIRNKNSVIADLAAKLTAAPSFLGLARRIAIYVMPASIKRLFDLEKYMFDTQAVDFFLRIIKDTIRKREEDPARRRPDYLQVLLDTRSENTNSRRHLSDDHLVAQCLLFYLAGYNGTSHAITWAARLLAFNPDAQRRLQAEIDGKLRPEDGVRFEIINDMPYLDNVLWETLRLYPLTQITRSCTKPYHLPGSGVKLETGTLMYFHVYGMHHDPDIYPNPEEFDPDRFLPEVKATRHPYAYLPFGHGPRNCVGLRVALLQAKLALVAILRQYTLSPGPKSSGKIPVLSKKPGHIQEVGGTWLKMERRV